MTIRNKKLYPGIFITFEGIDGAGKSTHIEHFSNQIQMRFPNKKVHLTREPGGTDLGEVLRSELLHRSMHLETEALLMFAARREHLSQIIEPALSHGDIVISDRFSDASFAYQCGGRGLSIEKLTQLENWVQMRHLGDELILLKPDLTLLFDLPSDIAQARRSGVRSPDKFEILDLAFFEGVRTEYLRRAGEDRNRFRIIDACQTIGEIQIILEELIASI